MSYQIKILIILNVFVHYIGIVLISHRIVKKKKNLLNVYNMTDIQ